MSLFGEFSTAWKLVGATTIGLSCFGWHLSNRHRLFLALGDITVEMESERMTEAIEWLTAFRQESWDRNGVTAGSTIITQMTAVENQWRDLYSMLHKPMRESLTTNSVVPSPTPIMRLHGSKRYLMLHFEHYRRVLNGSYAALLLHVPFFDTWEKQIARKLVGDKCWKIDYFETIIIPMMLGADAGKKAQGHPSSASPVLVQELLAMEQFLLSLPECITCRTTDPNHGAVMRALKSRLT